MQIIGRTATKTAAARLHTRVKGCAAAAVTSTAKVCSAPLVGAGPHLLYFVLYSFTSPVKLLRPMV